MKMVPVAWVSVPLFLFFSRRGVAGIRSPPSNVRSIIPPFHREHILAGRAVVTHATSLSTPHQGLLCKGITKFSFVLCCHDASTSSVYQYTGRMLFHCEGNVMVV